MLATKAEVDEIVDQARVGGDSFMCGYIRGGKLGGSKVEPVHVDRNNALIVDRDCEEGQGRRCDGGDRFSEFKCSPNDSSKICYGDLIILKERIIVSIFRI